MGSKSKPKAAEESEPAAASVQSRATTTRSSSTSLSRRTSRSTSRSQPDSENTRRDKRRRNDNDGVCCDLHGGGVPQSKQSPNDLASEGVIGPEYPVVRTGWPDPSIATVPNVLHARHDDNATTTNDSTRTSTTSRTSSASTPTSISPTKSSTSRRTSCSTSTGQLDTKDELQDRVPHEDEARGSMPIASNKGNETAPSKTPTCEEPQTSLGQGPAGHEQDHVARQARGATQPQVLWPRP